MQKPPRTLVLLSGILSLLIFSQIVVGGFVGSSGAALACLDFPTCGGQWLSDSFTGAQMVQMGHRYLGFLVLGLMALFLACSFASSWSKHLKKGHVFGLLLLVFCQINIGIANVHLHIPVSVTVLHLVVAELILFGTVLVFKELALGKTYFWAETDSAVNIALKQSAPEQRRKVVGE